MIRIGKWVTAGLALVAVLSACTPPAGNQSPTADTAAVRQQLCQEAVDGVVLAVEAFVEPYNTSYRDASDSASPRAGAPSADTDVQAALQVAQRIVRENECDEKTFIADLDQRLSQVTTRGAVAKAVLRRMAAGMTGRITEKAGRISVAVTDDLAQRVAEAAAGSTLVLPAATFELAEPLVLLDGLSIVGAGRSDTVLATSAEESGIFVLTADLVLLSDLTVRRDTKSIGSGIVAGPSAVLSLSDVVVRGARAGEGNQGGAGIHMSAEGNDASGRGTTLEVTDSQFHDNSWAGVAVGGGHRVSIITSTFRDNDQCGVCFLAGGEGSVSESRFTDNGIGVAVIGDARPAIASNRITGGEVGIQVGETARPKIDRNTIKGAKKAALIYTDKAAGTLGHTTCRDVSYGIILGKDAVPTLIDNDCTLARSGK